MLSTYAIQFGVYAQNGFCSRPTSLFSSDYDADEYGIEPVGRVVSVGNAITDTTSDQLGNGWWIPLVQICPALSTTLNLRRGGSAILSNTSIDLNADIVIAYAFEAAEL